MRDLLPFHEINPHLKDIKEKDQGDKKIPLLVLHGFMGSAEEGAELLQQLSDPRYLLFLDLPGHGQALYQKYPHLSKLQSFSDVAKAIINTLDFLKIQTCHLLGYSMGGRLAFYLLSYYPQYFQKAFIESAHPGLSTMALQKERYQQDKKLLDPLLKGTLTFEDFLHQWYQQEIFGQLCHHPFYTQLIQKRMQNDPEELRKGLALLSVGNQPSLWKNLQRGTHPLFYFSGKRDQKYSKLGEELQYLRPNIYHFIIEQCGHNAHFENPKAFLALLNAHLN